MRYRKINYIEDYNYRLEIVQQPKRACEYNYRSQQLITPVAILKLHIANSNGDEININDVDSSHFLLEASLIDTLTYEDKTMMPHRNLLGNSVINPQKLYGLDDDLGLWFTFNDLSVRKEGDYMLRFRLFYNGRLPNIVNDIGYEYISEITFTESRPFVVYKKTQFPGDIEPTSLSINFYEQGVNIPLGSSVRRNSSSKYVEVISVINENDYFENFYDDDEFHSDFYEELSDDDKMNVDES